MKHNVLRYLLILGWDLLLYYFMLPPLNLTSPLFWTYLFMVIITDYIITIFDDVTYSITHKRLVIPKKYVPVPIILSSLLVLIFVINFILSPLFQAKSYSERIKVSETHDFATDVEEVDFNKTPLIDKDSSQKLGDRKMGEFTEWVSQFYVSDIYTQINYNNEIVRVTPLEYAGLIKYFTNRSDGVKGYIMVNSVNGEASLKTLDKGMKYLPSAHFFENLYRYLRLSYPTKIFDEASFEIDNDGNPYWIIPTIKYYGIGLKKEINGAIILDPITGESTFYDVEDIPTWVDHVYSADLIIEQIDNWGEYRNGFWNSLFGQKNVINTTEGYNYLVMDDDVYLYTGITSVASDESNLGFVLVNMRTKETNYYTSPGAEEFSAMASAEGLVQDKEYEASFPLLINLNGKATYLLSLKDDAGLVKMYSFIDVKDYQKVIVSDASLGIIAARDKYLNEFKDNNVENKQNKIITIKEIKSAVLDGTTTYYITDIDNNYYYVSINKAKYLLPFLKEGDVVNIDYYMGEVSEIEKIERNGN